MDRALSPGSLRIALLVAAGAAIVVLLGTFPEVVRFGCVGVIALAAFGSAGERRRRGGGWWTLLAAGAALSVAGAALAQASEGLGGLLAVLGGALVVVAATVGFPLD